MFKLVKLTVACGLVGTAVGCKEGSSTAPTPSKPASDGSRSTKTAKLTVKSPGSQTVTQDRTDELTVSIDRDNITGPVTIALEGLPKGVTVDTKDLTIAADKSSLVVTVKAAPDAAPVVDHVVQVTAKAKEATDLPPATTDFKLTVKSK